jgi:hypothetical protein
MSKKDNLQLFKERITLTDYERLLQELSDAIDNGPLAVKRLLFGEMNLELYSEHGVYESGDHNNCRGLQGNKCTEKRLCKCMYYLNINDKANTNYKTACDKCEFKDRFKTVGEYFIADYEVPAHYYGDGIGEIDLIISDGKTRYATEVKPYKNNSETLLRMVAEIMTYTHDYSKECLKKAIGFFEINREKGTITDQKREFDNVNPLLLDIIKKADITVFCFEETGEQEYRICKL